MSEITSRPYRPALACERCCFGSGIHAKWCEHRFDVRMCREHFSPRPCWRCGDVRFEGLAGSGGDWVRERFVEELKMTPEQKEYWLFGSWSVNPAMPKDAIAFVSPRGRTVTYDAAGNELSSVDEPEAEWAKRCGVITGLKEQG